MQQIVSDHRSERLVEDPSHLAAQYYYFLCKPVCRLFTHPAKVFGDCAHIKALVYVLNYRLRLRPDMELYLEITEDHIERITSTSTASTSNKSQSDDSSPLVYTRYFTHKVFVTNLV